MVSLNGDFTDPILKRRSFWISARILIDTTRPNQLRVSAVVHTHRRLFLADLPLACLIRPRLVQAEPSWLYISDHCIGTDVVLRLS